MFTAALFTIANTWKQLKCPSMDKWIKKIWSTYIMKYYLAIMCQSFSHVQLFVIPWTVACQAPLSVGFSRQEYWSGLPFPSPGHLPDPGIEPRSPTLPADSLPSEISVSDTYCQM